MDESVLLPSPNWFQVSGMKVSPDGWLVYGGPSKSLCVLEPVPAEYDAVVQQRQGYKAHVVNRAHYEKIVSVDISPEWPTKRALLTGSADGTVKQWSVTQVDKELQLKSTHVHEVHSHEKEEIAGVGYSNETYAVTVGVFGNIVKWDMTSNVVKSYNSFMKNFKPISMTCSRHVLLNVAVGTKQGVIFVLDLNGPGKVVYKVRGHDEDITYLSWCPQFEVIVHKKLKDYLTARLDRIRNEPELNDSGIKITNEEESQTDSQNEVSVVEEDLFDMYKDHAADEFGHKKYEPEDIYVPIKDEKKEEDFLAECQRLKNEILKKKTESEVSIETLVNAIDNVQIVDKEQRKVEKSEVREKSEVKVDQPVVQADETSSAHVHRHLLCTVGKHGSVRVWSKTGKLVSSCSLSTMKSKSKAINNWNTVFWYKPDVLLLSDAKNQLLQCNPLNIDAKNKLEWQILHSQHKRGLYSITSAAPRVQNADTVDQDWPIWTVAQDRNLISYSLRERKVLATNTTCGGFVYTVAVCPYDAKKIAVSVGDGAVRVWESDTMTENEEKLAPGHVNSYWQNVQGKVLTVAWHPTKENLLAFGTAESRVGIIDSSGKTEKPAKVLRPAHNGGVYGLCWGEGNNLYACGGGELAMYQANKLDEAPTTIPVELEGKQWKLAEVLWTERALLVGSTDGAVAALTSAYPHKMITAAFPFTKIIHSLAWHPQQVSDSSEESQNKNLVAVCSNDKQSNIAIMELGEADDGSIKLGVTKTLSGHKGPVLRVAWNPHREAQLVSTSQDYTVRVWDVTEGVCKSIFGNHGAATLGVSWSGHPSLPNHLFSGGADGCLRLWSLDQYPAESYVEVKHETEVAKTKKEKKQKIKEKTTSEEVTEDQVAAQLEAKVKASKKFILPLLQKEIIANSTTVCRKLLRKHVNKEGGNGDTEKENGEDDADCDFIKIFSNTNELNEVVENELSRHLDIANHEAWIMLSILRGHMADVFTYASQKDLVDSFLLSLAPSVSFKYWKDATLLYLAQIDRFVAKGEESKLLENRSYGGPVYRKVALLLSLHDILGAVKTLIEARLFKEAYVLCRLRHMDSVATDVLKQWADEMNITGVLAVAASCYIMLGNLSQAASVLGKSSNEEFLSLAAEIAKVSGENTYAHHIVEKTELIKAQKAENVQVDQDIKELPSRLEAILKCQDASK